MTRWMFLCLLAVASDAMAEAEVPERDPDMVKCRASGGTNYDSDPAAVKRCECPKRLDRLGHTDHGKQLVNGLDAEDLGCLVKPVGQLDQCFTWTELQCKPVREVVRTVAGAAAEKPRSCQERCEDLGSDHATWKVDAPEGQQCQPVDTAGYAAGRCDIVPWPARPVMPRSCQERCEDLGSDYATWRADAPEGQQCQPVDTAGYAAGRCDIVPKSGEVKVVEHRGAGIGGSGLHVGPEAIAVMRHGNTAKVPFGVGPLLRAFLDIGVTRQHALSVAAGMLITGNGGDIVNTPVGVYGNVLYHIRLDHWFGMAGGSFVNAVGLDRYGDTFLTEIGGTIRLEFLMLDGLCRFSAGGDTGWNITDQELAFGVSGIIGCIFPGPPSR